MYTLSIITKFHAEPHYPLGGSEPSHWVHTFGLNLRLGLTHSIGTKT